MKKKILISIISVFFIVTILSLNNVWAIGRIGQAWKKTESGEDFLLFREYTGPYETTVTNYHDTYSSTEVENGKWTYYHPKEKKLYTSKWIDTQSLGFEIPMTNTFSTIGFAFHTEPIGDYSSTEQTIGYNKPTSEAFKVGDGIGTIQSTYNNSIHVKTTPGIKNSYKDVVFYTLMKSTGTFYAVDYGTEEKVKNVTHANYLGYRYTIVSIDGTSNVEVDDYKIEGDNLTGLITSLKQTDHPTYCYESNIITSGSKHSSGELEVARSTYRFFTQYNKESWWGEGTRGVRDSEKGMGAVANLYDNKLVFPQFSKRTALVRHINIGSNTVISTEIVNAGQVIGNYGNIITMNPAGTIANDVLYNTNTYQESQYYEKYENSEYYPQKFDMEQTIIKPALQDTTTYKFLGSNVAVSNTLGGAISSIATKISNGEMDEEDLVTVPGKDVLSDSDYIVIDFYYTEYDKEVQVNYLYIDKNNKVIELKKQNIIPNETATIKIGTTNYPVNRINDDTYIKSVYVKKLGRDLLTTTANSLENNEYATYVGYETSTTIQDAKDIIGNTKNPANLINGDTATISGNIQQVNYYYKIEKDVYVNHLYIDKTGKIRRKQEQNIVPNETAKRGTTGSYKTVNRINEDKYIVENYITKTGQNIKVKTASSLNGNNDVIYMGYQTFTEKKSIDSIAGKYVFDDDMSDTSHIVSEGSNASTETEVTIDGETVQVNFYYKYEKEVKMDEPKKDIKGSVFVEGSVGEKTISCRDIDEIDLKDGVVTIPSGSEAKVGVYNIPKYMVAAITTEYVSPIKGEKTKKLSAKLTMGDLTEEVDFGEIQYRAGYYRVTDMAVFKLSKVTINDAGESGTSGTSLFNWSTKDVKPTDMNLDIQLTGIDGKPIANTSSDIGNTNNYVSTKFVDSKGNEFRTEKTYLTKKQLDSVDADKDGAVTESDKNESDKQLNDLKDNLEAKEKLLATAQGEYDAAVNERNSLRTALDTAGEDFANAKKRFQELEDEKTQKLSDLNELAGKIMNLEQEIEVLKGELEDLEEAQSNRGSDKSSAEAGYNYVMDQYGKLAQAYTDAINKRLEYESAKDCNDHITEEMNKYAEIYKEAIDAAEKCREDKQKYEELKQAEEEALNKYNDYYNNEVTQAEKAKEEAEKAYNDALAAVNQKHQDIYRSESGVTILENDHGRQCNEYRTFINETYTPAKEDRNAKETILNNAQEAYDTNIEAGDVEREANELNDAKEEHKKAADAYNEYFDYRETLYVNFDEYKALYDEFMSIKDKTNAEIAEMLDLHLNIYVQNMTVKVNGAVLTNAKDNTAQKTVPVADLLNDAGNTTYHLTTEKPVINTEVYSGISKTNVDKADYNNKNKVETSTLNGIRALSGSVKYEAEVVIGDKQSAENMKDTVYYSDQTTGDTTATFILETTELARDYKVNTKAKTDKEKYEEAEPINIYTPISVSAKLESKKTQIVNQIQNRDTDVGVIQINTPFTITLGNDKTPIVYEHLTNTKEYSLGYYVKFDFDVHKVKVNGKTYQSGNRIDKGKWIWVANPSSGKDATLTAQAYGNLSGNTQGVIAEENGSYTVRAVAYNATTFIRNTSLKYLELADIKAGELKKQVQNICLNRSIIPAYFDQQTYDVIVVNRAYDFRITDIKDVNWKTVFRYNTNTNTNVHKGTSYYSGIYKWNTTSDKNNEMANRPSAEIGRNPLRILPVGPYKNSDSTYTKAPKMGYRFSFDMKVTGSYYDSTGNPKEDKKVEITTKFYYISKDGKKYLKESDGSTDGIYLFYKTSAGKYVRIDENGGGYALRFTPNDGYRYITDLSKETLSKTSVALGNLRKIELKNNMATVANNGAVITYYGEYKLPNSTIAVEVKDGKYDINKPLTNGYIGVIFDIQVYAGKMKNGDKTTDVILSYSKDTLEEGTNTSQWDYEGFLGFENAGTLVQDSNLLTLKLEKGTWKIDNDTYNEIKGSVMLYDLDLRAASDYE